MSALRRRITRRIVARAVAIAIGTGISAPPLIAAPPEPFPASTAVPAPPADTALRQLPIRVETLPDLPRSPQAHVAEGSPRPTTEASQPRPMQSADEDVATEHVIERYEDGSVRVDRWVALNDRGSFVNHGRWQEFDRQGNIIANGSWELGRREGAWFKQIPESSLEGLGLSNLQGFVPPFRSSATFRDGLLHGDWQISDGRNRIVASWHYEQGRRNGLSVWYRADGEERLQVNYDDDLPSGESLVWSDDAKAAPRKVTYGNGMALETRVQWLPGANGQRRRQEASYLVPSTLGIVAHSWEANRIEFAPVQDAEPIQHGPVRSWHENGMLAEQGQYALGTPTGQFHWWYPTGQPQAVGSFEDGEPHDKWVWWHENGMRRAEGEFASGNRIGTWRSWNEQGQLTDPNEEAETGIAADTADQSEPQTSARRRSTMATAPRRGVSRR